MSSSSGEILEACVCVAGVYLRAAAKNILTQDSVRRRRVFKMAAIVQDREKNQQPSMDL
jgi:hypothetical protein